MHSFTQRGRPALSDTSPRFAIDNFSNGARGNAILPGKGRNLSLAFGVQNTYSANCCVRKFGVRMRLPVDACRFTSPLVFTVPGIIGIGSQPEVRRVTA